MSDLNHDQARKTLADLFKRKHEKPEPEITVTSERLVSVPRPVTTVNPTGESQRPTYTTPALPARPVYQAPEIVDEDDDEPETCALCGRTSDEVRMDERDGEIVCVECARDMDEDDENRGSDLYTEEEHEALLTKLGERERASTVTEHDRDEAEDALLSQAGELVASLAAAMPVTSPPITTPDPLTQAVRSEVMEIMEQHAEQAVDQAINDAEILALAHEAATLLRVAPPEAQAQAVAQLTPVKQAIEQADSLTARIALVPFTVATASHAIREYITYLKGQFIERDDLITHLAIVTIAKMHLACIGPAGAAKSQVMRLFMAGIPDVSKASYQGSAFATPDELLGPISVRDLELNNTYKRNLEGRMAGVKLYELDEGFRLTAKAFNVGLRALNEREVFNPDTIGIPLHSCYVASNDYPADPELRALRDRFAVRMFVGYVSDENFKRMMRLKQDETPAVTVPWAAFETLHAELERLVNDDESYPEGVLDLVLTLRTQLRSERVDASDRIMKWGRRLMTAKALLEGRTVIVPSDLWVLQHTLWDDAKDLPKVRAAIETLVGRLEEDMAELEKVIVSVKEAYDKALVAMEEQAKINGRNVGQQERINLRVDTIRKVDDIKEQLDEMEAKNPLDGALRATFDRLREGQKALRNHVNPVRVQI